MLPIEYMSFWKMLGLGWSTQARAKASCTHCVESHP
jgi:hypothetical protein